MGAGIEIQLEIEIELALTLLPFWPLLVGAGAGYYFTRKLGARRPSALAPTAETLRAPRA